MEQHIKVVAILNIVLGAFGICLAVLIFLLFGGIAGIVSMDGDEDAQFVAPLMGVIGGIVFLAVAALSVPGLIAGIGLLTFKEWARILTIIVSVLNLISVPVGTVVGVYGLWVLLNEESAAFLKAKNAAHPPARGVRV